MRRTKRKHNLKFILDRTLMKLTLRSNDHSVLIAGRCIRRLVSLTDRVEDLVHEADRRACLDDPEVPSDEE